MRTDEDIFQELQALESGYRQKFPNAQELERFSFSAENLIEILREANGREVVFSYPLQLENPGACDGCEYSFKEAAVSQPHPITLQELLYKRHLPQNSRVKLVRHRDTKQDLHSQYRNQPQEFLDYQRQQGKKQGGGAAFDKCDYIVSFLGEAGSRARFIGVYKVEGQDQARETAEHVYYNLTEVSGFEALKERVVIDWGRNFTRNFTQWLDADIHKEVLEIQDKPFSKPFTGYLDFTLTFAELRELIRNQGPRDEWRRMLSAVSGVYLILDTTTGHHYVGSAYGDGGIWSRWAQYVARNGHGGNVGLRALTDLDPAHAQYFQFTLLMTLNRTTNKQEVQDWENIFKKKIDPKLCCN